MKEFKTYNEYIAENNEEDSDLTLANKIDNWIEKLDTLRQGKSLKDCYKSDLIDLILDANDYFIELKSKLDVD